MKGFWANTQHDCQSRYELWAVELGGMLFLIGAYSFAPNPIHAWLAILLPMTVFNVLAWRDRRRWKFHQALSRLIQPSQPQTFMFMAGNFGVAEDGNPMVFNGTSWRRLQ